MQTTTSYNIEPTKLVSVLEAIQLHKSKFRAHCPRTVAQLHCFRTSLSIQRYIAIGCYTRSSYPKIRNLCKTHCCPNTATHISDNYLGRVGENT